MRNKPKHVTHLMNVKGSKVLWPERDTGKKGRVRNMLFWVSGGIIICLW